MQYRRLGSSGLQLSALSFGAWTTFGNQVGRDGAREMLATAWDHGVNFFDNAETYANGEAERVMGDALADLRLPRDSYCVSSKVFFGSVQDPRPTQRGLSRKHVVDACHDALRRLRVDSPRALMEALRGRDTGDKVEVGYLRNRGAGTAMISVPEPMRFPVPPAPPAPPAPPSPPTAVPAPPAPPAPPPPPPFD